MDLISRLPTCLSGCLLSEWITLRDIAKLDSSFCSTSTRTYFLTLIQSDECVSRDATFYLYNHNLMLRWVLLRDVKLCSVCCASDSDHRLLTDHGNSNANARHVKCLELRYTPLKTPSYRNLVRLTCNSLTQVECDLIGKNLHLQYLTVSDYDDATAYKVAGSYQLLELVINVEPFRMFMRSGRTSHHLSLLSAAFATPSLRKLVLGCVFMLLDECVLSTFADRCTQLEVLEIDNNHVAEAQLVEICRKCPRIHRLVLKHNDYISDQGIVMAVQHLPLRSLCLPHCENLTSDVVSHIGQHCADTLTELQLDERLRSEGVDNALSSYFSEISVNWVRGEDDESDSDDYDSYNDFNDYSH